MKTAIIGSRGITSFNLSEVVPDGTTAIISGGAKGVDALAAAYAKSHGLQLIDFLPSYERFGRSAPLVRNRQIVEAADIIVAVWDGESRGTRYTVNYAKKLGKKVLIYKPQQ